MKTWILVYKDTNEYIGWSKAEKKPKTHDDNRLLWVKWDKDIPNEAETSLSVYVYVKSTKELVKQ